MRRTPTPIDKSASTAPRGADGLPPLRVFLVDPYPVMRDGLRIDLRTESMVVVGEAASGSDALRRILEQSPDAVVFDLYPEGARGLETVRRIRQDRPGTSVIACSSRVDPDWFLEALDAGVAAFTTKEAKGTELADLIRRAAKGDDCRRDAHWVAQFWRIAASQSRPPKLAPFKHDLTPRELEVLQALASGLARKSIPKALGITNETVKCHIGNILRKTGAKDRTQAVAWAARRGLVTFKRDEPDPPPEDL